MGGSQPDLTRLCGGPGPIPTRPHTQALVRYLQLLPDQKTNFPQKRDEFVLARINPQNIAAALIVVRGPSKLVALRPPA